MILPSQPTQQWWKEPENVKLKAGQTGKNETKRYRMGLSRDPVENL